MPHVIMCLRNTAVRLTLWCTAMDASAMTGMYRTHTIMMEGHMFPNNSPASEAFVVGRFKNISTAITDSPKR